MIFTENDIKFWMRVKSLAKNNLGQVTYDFFIEPAKLLEIVNHDVKIYLVDSMHRDFWRKQENLIKRVGFEVFGTEINVSLYSSSDINLADYDDVDKMPEVPSSPDSSEKPEAMTVTQPVVSGIANGLDDKATFENFAQNEGNYFAFGASIAVANIPGEMYNPLFIYGGSGLGKTHLMYAIGQKILSDRPNAHIKYVTSESFVNDYVQSSRKNQMQKFREEYWTLDLLLLDDIQFLAGKMGTIEEFFQIFDVLFERGAQIVISSDRTPSAFNEFEERLKARFGWGLVVDIMAQDDD